jgi:hypothetical protein
MFQKRLIQCIQRGLVRFVSAGSVPVPTTIFQ